MEKSKPTAGQPYQIRIGWTTTSSFEEAEKIAKACVENDLAVCAQIDGPIISFYKWEGEFQNDEEYRLTIKFLKNNAIKLENLIVTLHTYEVPQWVTVEADHVMTTYLNWAQGEVSQPDYQRAKELSRQGFELLKKRRYDKAERVFREALEMDSENTYILVGLGDLYREKKKFTDAISFYDRVLELDSVNVFALRGAGDSYRGLNQLQKSISYWQRYIEQNPNDIHVLTRLADTYAKINSLQESEEYYLKALKVNDKDKYALRGIGFLYAKRKDNKRALEFFDLFLAQDSTYVAVLTMAGNICRHRAEFDKASEYYDKALKQEPWNSFALYGMGDTQRGMQNYEEAIHWLSKILEKEPHNQEVLSRVGDFYLNLDRLEEARNHYQESLKIGFDLYALLGLARLHRKNADYDAAEVCCKKILDEIPVNRRGLEEILQVYEEKGDLESADKIREVMQASLENEDK